MTLTNTMLEQQSFRFFAAHSANPTQPKPQTVHLLKSTFWGILGVNRKSIWSPVILLTEIVYDFIVSVGAKCFSNYLYWTAMFHHLEVHYYCRSRQTGNICPSGTVSKQYREILFLFQTMVAQTDCIGSRSCSAVGQQCQHKWKVLAVNQMF